MMINRLFLAMSLDRCRSRSWLFTKNVSRSYMLQHIAPYHRDVIDMSAYVSLYCYVFPNRRTTVTI